MALIPKPLECYSCSLFGSGQGFSQPEGMGTCGVMIMGEALGEQEEQAGLPMRPYAQGGSIMERAIRRASTKELPLAREMFRLWNVVACRPPENRLEHTGYEFSAISHCEVHRSKVINEFLQQHRNNPLVKQPVILATGNVPFRTLTGIAGKKRSVTYLRGYPVRTPYGLVLPTFHFAYVARTRKLIGVLVHDVYKAVMLARNGFQERPRRYFTRPDPSDLRSLRDFALGSANAHKLITFDIETDNIEKSSRMWPNWHSIQFSMAPGSGYFLDVDSSTLPLIRDILAGPNPKAGHNVWRFDNRVLRERYDLKINGRIDDTMWMFHHWEPDLTIESSNEDKGGNGASLSTRAGLQFAASFFGMDFAWKHLNESEPRFYGIADVDACQCIMASLPGFMQAKNVFRGYDELVLGNESILMDMYWRGIPIDNEGRLSLHDVLVRQSAEIDSDLQRAYPDHLRNVEPPAGLVNEPNVDKGKYRKVFLV